MNVPQRAVIVFAGALIDAPLLTNRQQIATRLAGRGWRVLYVEPRLGVWRQLLGGGRGTEGRWSWARRSFLPLLVAPNLWVVSQWNLIPGSRRWWWIGKLNHQLRNAWWVRKAARRLGFLHPTLLVYDTEAAEFLDDFPKARLVYDCVDDHRAQRGGRAHVRLVEQEEAAIAARADAIAVVTEPLLKRFAQTHPAVYLVPNAADVPAFRDETAAEPADVAKIPHPRIGTVGALDAYKLDVPLLARVARQHSAWHFVLVGPVEYARGWPHSAPSGASRGRPHFALRASHFAPWRFALYGATRDKSRGGPHFAKASRGGVSGESSIRELHNLPNVHFLGPKPRERVPAYVHAFDVAMIPYRKSPYNDASFPLKFWEFLAAGKPVVASGLPSLPVSRHLVTRARDPDAFVAGIREALGQGSEGREARRAEAQRHDWPVRVDALEQLLVEGS